MNRDFFRKAVFIPFCLAVVIGIALFIYLKVNIDSFIPLTNNTQYAFHDEIAEGMEFKADKNADISAFEKNQCMGVLRAGEGYPIRYDMDYSNIQTSVSFVPGSVEFGQTGFIYICSGNKNADKIKKDKTFTVSSVFGENNYKFKAQKKFNSEYSVLNYAPKCESAVIIYYRESASFGFTSKYVALIYEEVK